MMLGKVGGEFKLLLRSRLAMVAWLAFVSAVAFGLWLGWAANAARHAEIARALELQSEQHATYWRKQASLEQGASPPDAGSVAYYNFHVVQDAPGPLAWLSAGNRESLPTVQRIRMLGLQGQIYDGEAHNPEAAAAGVFDFGFAVVFLLPLLCIGLCHDLATQDREQGRDGLLASLAGRGLWWRRLFARYVLACAAVLLPLAVFVLMLGIVRLELLSLAIAIAVYAALWTAVCAWISLRWQSRASTANAMRMLALWVAITLALPALANSAIALLVPASKGGEIALAQRKKVNDAWDLPKEDTFKAFFRWHPEWRETPPVTGRFHWKWYYAFHHVADRAVQPLVDADEAAMHQRDRLGAWVGIALPAVAMQNIIDGLADNGNRRLIAHRRAIAEFHDRMRVYFYPFVFEERPFTAKDFAAIPKPRPAASVATHAMEAWFGLLGLLALFGVALWRRLSRPAFGSVSFAQ
jgi:ABC-2 type transport system permease protein